MIAVAGGIFAGAQLVILHGQLGGGGVEAVDVPGAEYRLPADRSHYRLSPERSHYRLSGERSHWRVEEE